MASKIINLQNNLKRSPVTAFWLSFFFPGAGQLYNRSAAKALFFFFMRIIPLLLMPLSVYFSSVNISIVLLFTVLFVFFLSFLAAFESFSDAKKNITYFKNRMLPVIVFILLSGVFTVLAVFPIYQNFSLKLIINNSDSPHLMRNDVVLIVKNPPKGINVNDLVVINKIKIIEEIVEPNESNETDKIEKNNQIEKIDKIGKIEPNFYRVIALNKSNIQIVTDVIIINGSGLIKGLLSEKENKLFSKNLHIENIVSESNLEERYAIISSNILNFEEKVNLNDNEFFLAKDNRLEPNPFNTVAHEEIFGRVDSVFLSLSLKRIFLRTKLGKVVVE